MVHTRTLSVPVVLVAMVLLAAIRVAAAQETLVGEVVGISDGDTLTVRAAGNRRERIRLNGIDAPESAQDFGRVAKQRLSDLVFGQRVTIEAVKRDRYGRLVGTVRREDGTDVSIEQLRSGMAWYFRRYAEDVPLSLRPAYEAAEEASRAARRGLWAQTQPTPPWEFRSPTRVSVGGGDIVGNRRSMIYHLPPCPDYAKIAEQNRVVFRTEDAAVQAGYRKARNCP